ncbi:hypothetical protein [Celeribacter sp. ULVN23_4]
MPPSENRLEALALMAERLDALEAELSACRAQASETGAEAELQAMRTSLSWRVTAPLRSLSRVLIKIARSL